MKILTFDIEDWFHILDFDATKNVDSWKSFNSRIHSGVDRILELLDEKDQKATFFCLGWVAERYPEVIEKIFNEGHEIGSHSYAHQLVYEQDISCFKNDLVHSLRLIEDITSSPVTIYRAPGFSITSQTSWAFDVLCECGINVDCSIFPAGRGHGGLATYDTVGPSLIENSSGQSIKELPISYSNFLGKRFVYSGGGYFRLLPYSVVSNLINSSKYTMTYFHPRDFDPEQPVLQGLSRPRRFKSYVGLNRSFGKLSRLLDDHKFITVQESVSMVDWSNVTKFNTKDLFHID